MKKKTIVTVRGSTVTFSRDTGMAGLLFSENTARTESLGFAQLRARCRFSDHVGIGCWQPVWIRLIASGTSGR